MVHQILNQLDICQILNQIDIYQILNQLGVYQISDQIFTKFFKCVINAPTGLHSRLIVHNLRVLTYLFICLSYLFSTYQILHPIVYQIKRKLPKSYRKVSLLNI